LAQTPGPLATDAPLAVPKRKIISERVAVSCTATGIAIAVLVEIAWIAYLGCITIKIVEWLADG
jgi:hypothetical protein